MRENMKKGFEHWQVVTVYLMIYDAIAINLSYFLALWLRFDCRYTQIEDEYLHNFARFAPIYTVICIVVFLLLLIRDERQIYKLFYNTVSDICDDLADRYHYDPCFDVNVSETISAVDITQVCIITSSASSDKLRIYVSMTLDGEMDATSFLEIEAKHRDEVVAAAECVYHNGDGYEKDDGSCDIKSGSDYDDHEIRDFMDNVTAYIEEELNPNIKRLSDLEYECERYGGYYPVADFACAECGKNGVSVRDDFLPIGKCCYCGYENEVNVCERCGTIYDDSGGDKHLCNGCLPQDE